LAPGALSQGIKRPGSEGDHSPPSMAEVKNGGGFHSAYVFMALCLINEAAGQFYILIGLNSCIIQNYERWKYSDFFLINVNIFTQIS
jgi:hypothetical protein